MDRCKLEYEFKRNNYMKVDICKILEISKSELYRKMKRDTEFTQGEIKKLIEILD